MRLGAVILAAGQSKRFGKENKLLHAVDGEILLHRVLRAFAAARLEKLVVVLGHEAEAVGEALAEWEVQTVFNAKFTEGMGGSLACGVRGLAAECLDGLLLCVGDLPGLRAGDVERVRDAFVAEAGRSVVVPCFAGRNGHPVCFPNRLFEALGDLRGDEGARKIIAGEGDKVRRLEMPDAACIQDLDVG